MRSGVTFLVIGSGPSGVAAVSALIRAGHRPIVIDGGIMPDDQALKTKQALEMSPANYPKGNAIGGRTNPGQKAWFGSLSAFTQNPAFPIRYASPFAARASLGVGGFSRVWGGTFSFAQSMSEWPQDCIPRDSDIDAVRQLVPHATTVWARESFSPPQGGAVGARSSMLAMARFRARCRNRGWTVQASTVAIDVDAKSSSACRPCGQCLTGCPRDAIWYSAAVLDRWNAADLVDYRPGLIAVQVSEQRESVEVIAKAPGGYLSLSGDRVLIAAGGLGTAALLIKSGFVDKLELADTSTAFVAALSLHRDEPLEDAHALSQWWIRSPDRMFSAQVYAPNVSHVDQLARRTPVGDVLRRPLGFVARRLHPIIAYLDPKLSDPVCVRRREGVVEISGKTGRDSISAFHGYLRDISAFFRRAGYLLPTLATEITAPGTGYHFGSSLPHGVRSDYLGRPFGLSRIHVVDASVLPLIEVGSITPTVMANAVRIARSTASLAQS